MALYLLLKISLDQCPDHDAVGVTQKQQQGKLGCGREE